MIDIDQIIKRIEKDGFALVKSDRTNSNIPKHTSYTVFGNRRLGESIIIDKNKLKLF